MSGPWLGHIVLQQEHDAESCAALKQAGKVRIKIPSPERCLFEFVLRDREVVILYLKRHFAGQRPVLACRREGHVKISFIVHQNER